MTESTATPERIRDAAEGFAFEVFKAVYEIAMEETTVSDERIVRASTAFDAVHRELVAAVVRAHGEEAGIEIVAEGHRIAKEIHAIAKRYVEGQEDR